MINDWILGYQIFGRTHNMSSTKMCSFQKKMKTMRMFPFWGDDKRNNIFEHVEIANQSYTHFFMVV